jgi:hypothetical protein
LAQVYKFHHSINWDVAFAATNKQPFPFPYYCGFDSLPNFVVAEHPPLCIIFLTGCSFMSFYQLAQKFTGGNMFCLLKKWITPQTSSQDDVSSVIVIAHHPIPMSSI